MSDAPTLNPIPVGLDDGYALPRSLCRMGVSSPFPHAPGWARRVTWINGAEQRIFEYETEIPCTRPVPLRVAAHAF